MIVRAYRKLRRPWCAITVAALSLPAARAAAEEASGPDVQNRTARERSPVNLVALTASARLADAQFAVTSWAGYDGAIENPRVGALVEARLIHRLAIAVGADSSSDEAGAFTLRPWWRCASSNRKK